MRHSRTPRRVARLASALRLRHWPSDLTRLSEALLIAAIFFCPLALGSARLSAVGIAALIAFLSLASITLARLWDKEKRPLLLPRPTFVLGAVAIAIGLQLCPLPPALLGLVAPATAELFETALGPVGLYPAFRPLSLDPPATARAALSLLSCLMGFVVAAQIASSSVGRGRLMAALGLSALGIALIGFGHRLAHAQSLFGVFAYAQAAPPLLTTFGNPNHLAAFLTIGALTLSTLALDAQDGKVRFAWLLAYLAVVSAIFLSLSRGGIAAFLVGQALVFWSHRALHREDGSALGSRRLCAALGLSAATAVALYLAAQKLFDEWSSLSSIEGLRASKLSLFTKVLPLLREHWLLGVGRGAFEPAFQRFLTTPGEGALTFTHPENLALQWMAELGIPLGALFLLCLAFCLWKGFRAAGRDTLRWGALLAVFSVGLHDLADFSLEFLGTALPACVALACGVGHRSARRVLRPHALLMLLPVIALASGVCFWFARHDLRHDTEGLDALRRHPADYFPRLAAAQKALSEDRPAEALTWAGHAMSLYPALAMPHAIAAQALERRGALPQAATEWRLAFERGQKDADKRLAHLFHRRLLPADRLLSAVPKDPALALRLANAFLTLEDTELARQLTDHLGSEDAEDSIELLNLRARIADQQRDFAELLSIGEKLERTEGLSGHRGVLFQSRALWNAGDRTGALARLESRLDARSNAAIALKLAELELAQSNLDAAAKALRRLPLTLSIPERVRVLEMEAAIARREGAFAKAVTPLRTAVNLKPGDPNLRMQLAEALERAGRFDAALQEARQCRRVSKSLAQRVDALERRIAEEKAQRHDAARSRELGLGR
ncbi:MAG: O-antigen ligase family protein [Myxococcales bacterium]|jgi:thioredoxin-like negative regulator of GroEL/O-antigen ligase|nr:O-antigen ligase family protein [Myxococcales bacterium]